MPRIDRSVTGAELTDSLSRLALGVAIALVIAPVVLVLVLAAADPGAFDGLGPDRDRFEQQVTLVVFVQGVLMLVPLIIGIVALRRGRGRGQGRRRSVAAIAVSIAGNLLLLAVLAFPILFALAERAA